MPYEAATSFSPEAWLKLASNWLALIPQQTDAASQQLKAVEAADTATSPAIIRRVSCPALKLGTVESLAVWCSIYPSDLLLDQHCFRSLRKLVIGNLDRIADVHNI